MRPGFFVGIMLQALDARMVVEDVATGQFICSDDSLDQAGRYDSEVDRGARVSRRARRTWSRSPAGRA